MKNNNDKAELTNRQKIVEMARTLIAQKGVQNTSLADISKAVGISKGTLFYYYPSKDDLVYEIVDEHFGKVTKSLIDKLETNGKISASEAIEMLLSALINDEELCKLNLYLLQQAVIENDTLKRKFIEKYKEWKVLLAEHLKKTAGAGHEDTFDNFAAVLLAAIDGLAIQSLLMPSSFNLKIISGYLCAAAVGANDKYR